MSPPLRLLFHPVVLWRVVGWRLYWPGGACLPRSPPPRTARHQTPPPLPPRPEWVPAICTLTHKYILSPSLCIHHIHRPSISIRHTPHPCRLYLLTLHEEGSKFKGKALSIPHQHLSWQWCQKNCRQDISNCAQGKSLLSVLYISKTKVW